MADVFADTRLGCGTFRASPAREVRGEGERSPTLIPVDEPEQDVPNFE